MKFPKLKRPGNMSGGIHAGCVLSCCRKIKALDRKRGRHFNSGIQLLLPTTPLRPKELICTKKERNDFTNTPKNIGIFVI